MEAEKDVIDALVECPSCHTWSPWAEWVERDKEEPEEREGKYISCPNCKSEHHEDDTTSMPVIG